MPKDWGVRRIDHDLPYGPHIRQKLDIYAPRNGGRTALPVIVFFYGGAWSDGNRKHYAFAAHALAALGYVVVVPDYRLVPQVEYPEFLRDCALAVHWTSRNIASYGGDWTRLVLAGHSAGAYNAAALALDGRWLADSELHKTVVGVIGLSGPYDFYPFDGPISQRVFGRAEDGKATQPINHVDASAPPMLLISGGRDELVLPRNSENLGASLERAGNGAVVRIFPRLAHVETLLALSLPLRWIAPVLDECRRFLAEVTVADGAIRRRASSDAGQR
ncbi:Acetyl esterase/lipase [Devosia lucknowensis]|uniref:Acetyl esterase/lipase n=1 Tax=Devosia lucknowensis TaxID=1096929 RepID=A0A1Y6FT25_9HYPH|nr:alpha/beta hydrolase [Devosia lucknowensis]SMQ76032.1 Acetyl esterase/lipase [Devosia lucknowensis]